MTPDPRDTHRPRTPAERRVAIAELRSRGLTARDIAGAMRLPLAEVLEALRGGRGSFPGTPPGEAIGAAVSDRFSGA